MSFSCFGFFLRPYVMCIRKLQISIENEKKFFSRKKKTFESKYLKIVIYLWHISLLFAVWDERNLSTQYTKSRTKPIIISLRAAIIDPECFYQENKIMIMNRGLQLMCYKKRRGLWISIENLDFWSKVLLPINKCDKPDDEAFRAFLLLDWIEFSRWEFDTKLSYLLWNLILKTSIVESRLQIWLKKQKKEKIFTK